MRKFILIYLVFAASQYSCSLGEDSDNLSGTYEVYRITLENCLLEEANLDVTFGATEDCVETLDFIHCKQGSLIVRSDMTVTSTIALTRASKILGITLPFISINGQGVMDVVGNIGNLCIDKRCIELEIIGGELIWNVQSLACNNRYVFRKVL